MAEAIPGCPIGKIANAPPRDKAKRTIDMTGFGDIEKAFSPERLARYVAWAGGDKARAMELYALNVLLSQTLYGPLQVLEVVLRNRIHIAMSATNGEAWFESERLLIPNHQHEQVRSARMELEKEGKQILPCEIVARLTFSFWTAMLGPAYEQLWRSTLHAIASKENGSPLARKQLSGALAPIRVLRNRIAHHESVLHWDLPKHHDKIHQLTAWLSPVASRWCKSIDRFPATMPIGGYALASDEPEGA